MNFILQSITKTISSQTLLLIISLGLEIEICSKVDSILESVTEIEMV